MGTPFWQEKCVTTLQSNVDELTEMQSINKLTFYTVHNLALSFGYLHLKHNHVPFFPSNVNPGLVYTIQNSPRFSSVRYFIFELCGENAFVTRRNHKREGDYKQIKQFLHKKQFIKTEKIQ